MMAPTTLISNRIARAALVLAGMGCAAPAMADEVNQIAIYGEVAPRCWVAHPMKIAATNAAVQVTPARAICNQARPVMLAEVRMIDSEGLLMKLVPAAADRATPLSTRTALEIVVTPQL
ncbi:MAG TPA: hypothetical protein VN047_09100 [Sphingopyxis sp.]|uniref:hypothetical protein n=1 Tax=Sphingopyxis sp. TaxID=1908224 RepID=UPI002B585C88|nr:hypothetical protein [Sphingopyxis sp.]HWW57036.1 hypothetical protein [Sphingopyxis sp.]